MNIIKRFEKFIDKSGSCWLWTGYKPNGKYGTFKLKVGKSVNAHRLSYELYKGAIPDGLIVCHTCDNPPCVNPEHLFLGTRSDNTRDMINKGRRFKISLKGSLNPSSKLTEEQVLEIRKLYSEGIKQTELVKLFKIKKNTISDIVNNKTWKHLLTRGFKNGYGN